MRPVSGRRVGMNADISAGTNKEKTRMLGKKSQTENCTDSFGGLSGRAGAHHLRQNPLEE